MTVDILNLGAGNKLVAGAVQHDRIRHRPEIDVVWDLNDLPWPWPDSSFDMIVACAVLEHLRITLIESVNECWRIMRPHGVLHVKLPYWNSDNAFRDPTHYWQFDLTTCDVFDPTTKYGHDYQFYTIQKWKIVKRARLNDAKTSFALTMQAIKDKETRGQGDKGTRGTDERRHCHSKRGQGGARDGEKVRRGNRGAG